MTLNLLKYRKYFQKNKIRLLSNFSDAMVHTFLKEKFRSYEITEKGTVSTLGDIHSFHFFEIQLYHYLMHRASISDLVIVTVTYSFPDSYGNTIRTLCIFIAKKEKVEIRVEKEVRIVEHFEEKSLHFQTLEILKRLYRQIETPLAFK